MKTIVIVGGGYAGVALAKQLEKQTSSLLSDSVRILLIDTKTHFYHSIAGLRGGVQNLDDRIFIPYTHLFKSPHNQVIHATVIRFDQYSIFLNAAVPDFGAHINFDFLVIASGMKYPAPARMEIPSLELGQQQIQQIRHQINQARHILIVGGGPCGIELAGEIRDEYKNKPLTLIHSQPQLGNASYISLRYHQQLLHLLESSNVKVILSDRVLIPTDNHHQTAFVPTQPLPKTRNDYDLSDVDFVILATGSKPNIDWVQLSFPELLDHNGFVKVKPSLQVDHPTLADRVFVIGDVAGLQETKMAYRAARSHAPLAATNIIKLLKHPNAAPDSLAQYKKGADIMLITFGKNKGAAMGPWGILAGNWFSSRMKSRTLMIDRFWKEMNLQAPTLTPDRSPSFPSSTVSLSLLGICIAGFSAFAYNYFTKR